MKTKYLLPNKYKIPGWILFAIGIFGGIFLVLTDYEADALTVKVFTIFSEPFIFGEGGFLKIIENSILDELIALAIIFGGLLVGFSREKIEDEFIYKLRKDSLVWAILVNYIVLILAILFVYELSFFDVLVFNMFTPLIFFIVRFNFLKHKSASYEE